jgi:hypothetical protein
MMFFILSILALLLFFLGVLYLIFEFSNMPQDFISYDDF